MALTTLREANLVRQAEWDKAGDVDLSYAGNELAGEAGEFIEAAADWFHNDGPLEAFRHEVADVIICCDLIALRLDLPLETDVVPYAVDQATDQILLDVAIQVGMVANTIKKRERERFGMVGARGSLEDLQRNLGEVVMHVTRVAAKGGFRAADAVAEKFNLTSTKYGLATRYEPKGN